jgi:uncharacterized YigZ family protein
MAKKKKSAEGTDLVATTSAEPGAYVTLARTAEARFEVKKSIFIGSATHTETEEEARAFIDKIRREHADATHNCFAYVARGGAAARCSDDGEPQGTAGIPILNVIKMSGATDLCVVVTRYFGGVLLGAGGLVRAYSHTARLAIEAAGIAVREYKDELTIVASYADYEKITRELPTFGAVIDNSNFTDVVTLNVCVKTDVTEHFVNRVREISAARAKVVVTGRRRG